MKLTNQTIKLCLATFAMIIVWQSSLEVASAQMEIRRNEFYHQQQFVLTSPLIGDSAPELELVTLSGERVRLSDYRDKQVVLIKAGYT